MLSIFLAVILVFLALLGVAGVFERMHRFMLDTGKLEGCTLLVEPREAETAEALLHHAAGLAELVPELGGVRLAVVCPPDAPARGVAERFCADRGLPLLKEGLRMDL